MKHKVLAIVEEEGVHSAAYALKLLQSEGVLTIARRAKTRRPAGCVTHQYRVEGPVMIFLTTTAIDLDEEMLNRCMVLTVNEDREQTQGDPPCTAPGADGRRAAPAAGPECDPDRASQRAAALEARLRSSIPTRRS